MPSDLSHPSATNPTEITTITNQNARHQRGERSRPCGNNSKFNGPQENSKDQVKTQATQSPPGSERRAHCSSSCPFDPGPSQPTSRTYSTVRSSPEHEERTRWVIYISLRYLISASRNAFSRSSSQL